MNGEGRGNEILEYAFDLKIAKWYTIFQMRECSLYSQHTFIVDYVNEKSSNHT